MEKAYILSFEEKEQAGRLTFSLFISIVLHSIVIILMAYFSYRAIAEGKVFTLGRGNVMNVNIYSAGELRGGLTQQQQQTTRIKKYEPVKEKKLKEDAIPELIPQKNAKPEMPVVAKNLPIGKGQAEAPSGISLGIGKGGIGGIGGGEIFPYQYYIEILVNKLQANWSVHILKNAKQKIYEAEIWFRISRTGDLLDYRIARSSGDESYDNACLRAVSLSSPFPPLPYQYEGKTLALSIVFYYTLD